MSTTSSSGTDTGTDGPGGGAFRRETYQGDEYLVAPVVAHQEGVYIYPRANGRGIKREYLPGEELTNTADAWEDTPLTLSHPTNADGVPGLTDDPGTEYDVVGRFRNVVTNDDDELGGQTWIAVDEVGDHDGKLEGYIDRVNRRGHGEVSTGYRSETEYKRGTYNEQRYSYIQRSPEPDHLALLVDETGNCSTEDGCGVGQRPNSLPPVATDAGVRLNHRTIDGASAVETDGDGDGDGVINGPTTDSAASSDSPTTNARLLTHTFEAEGEYDPADLDEAVRLLDSLDGIDATRAPGNVDPVLHVVAYPMRTAAIVDYREAFRRAFEGLPFDADAAFNEDADGADTGELAPLLTSAAQVANLGRSPGGLDVDADRDRDRGKDRGEDRPHTDGDEGTRTSDTVRAELQDIRARVNRLLGRTPEEPQGDTDHPETETENGDAGSDTTSGAEQSQHMSENTEKLVNEFELSEEVAQAIAGTDCEEDILNWAEVAADEGEGEDGGNGSGGSTGSDATDDDPPTDGQSGEGVTNEQVAELEETIDELEDTINELQQEREQEREQREAQLNKRLDEQTELGEETIEGMALEDKENLAADLGVEEDPDEDAAVNMAGLPGPTEYDYESDDEAGDGSTSTIPPAGRTNYERWQDEQGQTQSQESD